MSISLLQGKNINWLIKMGKSQTLLTFEIPTQEHPPPSHPPLVLSSVSLALQLPGEHQHDTKQEIQPDPHGTVCSCASPQAAV